MFLFISTVLFFEPIVTTSALHAWAGVSIGHLNSSRLACASLTFRLFFIDRWVIWGIESVLQILSFFFKLFCRWVSVLFPVLPVLATLSDKLLIAAFKVNDMSFICLKSTALPSIFLRIKVIHERIVVATSIPITTFFILSLSWAYNTAFGSKFGTFLNACQSSICITWSIEVLVKVFILHI